MSRRNDDQSEASGDDEPEQEQPPAHQRTVTFVAPLGARFKVKLTVVGAEAWSDVGSVESARLRARTDTVCAPRVGMLMA